ncbi:ataxin-7-like [Tachyglossus aculeatus]|uniref:ataxin-7-like n=1 Tax=Tachyglossus aculeatus TaxID=9261 RepID=UPI0018F62294|nr:ataxin-7-like [Tachyglossus aculeatus]
MQPEIDGALLKTAVGSSFSTAVSASVNTGRNCPSIPKSSLPSPGKTPNNKELRPMPPAGEKKPENCSYNGKVLRKRFSERELDFDICCGVIDEETKKPCLRALTCKSHSLTQRRAVQGRRQRFDVLLAEHKSKTRKKKRPQHLDQQIPPLSPSETSQELHPKPHGVIPIPKPLASNKPEPQNPSLPRPPGCPSQYSGNDHSGSPAVHDAAHPPVGATGRGSQLHSYNPGAADKKEEPVEKPDCRYSDHHPRPTSFCAFGSQRIGRGYYVFDKKWNRIQRALHSMLDTHLNSQMGK